MNNIRYYLITATVLNGHHQFSGFIEIYPGNDNRIVGC